MVAAMKDLPELLNHLQLPATALAVKVVVITAQAVAPARHGLRVIKVFLI